MSKYFKRVALLIMAVMFSALFLMAGAKTAKASEYYYFNTPADNATYKVGDEIPVSFYAGVVFKTTSFDAWGRPSTTTYETMPAQFKVFKGKTELYSEDFTYTSGTTLETTYTPTTAGTLQFCIYGKKMSLNAVNTELQATINIKVNSPKASAVKSIKPVITVNRIGKKEVEIECSNDSGFAKKIYRATKKNGKYTLVKATGKSCYTDTVPSASKVYYYKVQLFAKKGSKKYTSKWSAVKKADKFKQGVKLAYSAKKGVKVSWTAIKGAGYYLVCRNTVGIKGEYDVISCEEGKATVFYDKDVKKGKTYYYMIIAEKGNDETVVGKHYSNSYKIKVPK